MQFSAAPEEQGEGEMDKCISEVTVLFKVNKELDLKRNSGESLLGVAHDAPDTLTVHSSTRCLLLMAVQLIIGNCLKGKTNTKSENS